MRRFIGYHFSSNVGELVPFDEVYGNLSGEGEVSPDVRRELSRIEEVVPGAAVPERLLQRGQHLRLMRAQHHGPDTRRLPRRPRGARR